MSYNRLGEIIRYPTMNSREKIPSAVSDLAWGIRYNKSLQILDLSYNHLGPDVAQYFPSALIKNKTLHTLDLSGNHIGAEKSPYFLFFLAGKPNGFKDTKKKIQFIKNIKFRHSQGGKAALD